MSPTDSTKTQRAALTNASGMLACRALADGLSIAFFVVVSRLFGPEGVGAYSYGFALAAFVFAASSLGIEQYGVREYQRATPRDRTRILNELLALQIAVAVLALVLLALYLRLTDASLATMLIVYELSTYQLCCALAATLFVPALAAQDMLRPSLSALLTRSVAFVIAALVLLVGKGSLSVALLGFPLMSFVYVVLAIASARAHSPHLRPVFALAPMLKAARVLRSFATVDMLSQLLARAGIVVLTLMVGERSAGIYATGLKFVELAFLPLWFLGVALYPRLCRAHFEAPREFARQAWMLTLAAIAMTLLVAGTFVFILPHVLVPILGPAYAGTQAAIAATASVALVYGMEIALGRVLYARGQQYQRAIAMATGFALCVVLSIFAAPRMNVMGVIFATALAYFVIVLWYALNLIRAPHTPNAAHRDFVTGEPQRSATPVGLQVE